MFGLMLSTFLANFHNIDIVKPILVIGALNLRLDFERRVPESRRKCKRAKPESGNDIAFARRVCSRIAIRRILGETASRGAHYTTARSLGDSVSCASLR